MPRPRVLILLSTLLCVAVGACDGSDMDSDAGPDASRPGADAGAASDSGTPSDDAGPGADASRADGGASDAGPGDGTLSARYPGDEGIGGDPAVLFHDDFESGWGRWDRPSADTRYLHLESDASAAHGGAGYLRSTVTTADLEETEYISSSTYVDFERTDELYYRFHVRFPELAPNPHHWVRFAAGDASWESSGLANTVPPGDRGFWFDLDANTRDEFNFYVYWHQMRSGRCNDGTAVPGCEGDQGNTYHYGNTFRPPEQTPFPRDRWFCIEVHAVANTVGSSDGALEFWIDDAPVGSYRPGYPDGTWLRDSFHEGGCEFSACTPPAPFEGFDFRTSGEVGFKAFMLDAYYERGSNARKRTAMEERGLTVSDTNTILYDDVVIATERVGCRR